MVGGAKKTGSTGLNLAVSPTLSKLIFSDVLIPDHAVPIYKNSRPVNITFTVYRYPSETLGQFLRN
jgi:hypothetical protein